MMAANATRNDTTFDRGLPKTQRFVLTIPLNRHRVIDLEIYLLPHENPFIVISRRVLIVRVYRRRPEYRVWDGEDGRDRRLP